MDIGKSYINDTYAAEMIVSLSESIKMKTLTEPINVKKMRYYSVLNDGSSSAKTKDEKEVFLIKIAPKGKPEVSLISLEEPIEGDTNGLRDVLNRSISGLNLNEEFNRKTREIVMCSDGAKVNFSHYELLKTDLGGHYLHIWCPAHLL